MNYFTKEELATFSIAQLKSIAPTTDLEYNALVAAFIAKSPTVEPVFAPREIVVEVEETIEPEPEPEVVPVDAIITEPVEAPKAKVAAKKVAAKVAAAEPTVAAE